MLWGFSVQDVRVWAHAHAPTSNCGDDPATPATPAGEPLAQYGQMKYDGDRKAAYVMLRLLVLAEQAGGCGAEGGDAHDAALTHAAQSVEERAAVAWYEGLPQVVLALSMQAHVAHAGGASCAVEFVGDLKLRFVVASSAQQLDRYAPVLKTCRRRCLQTLPGPLQPLGLLSCRGAVVCRSMTHRE